MLGRQKPAQKQADAGRHPLRRGAGHKHLSASRQWRCWRLSRPKEERWVLFSLHCCVRGAKGPEPTSLKACNLDNQVDTAGLSINATAGILPALRFAGPLAQARRRSRRSRPASRCRASFQTASTPRGSSKFTKTSEAPPRRVFRHALQRIKRFEDGRPSFEPVCKGSMQRVLPGLPQFGQLQ